jgi:hypothetical protein
MSVVKHRREQGFPRGGAAPVYMTERAEDERVSDCRSMAALVGDDGEYHAAGLHGAVGAAAPDQRAPLALARPSYRSIQLIGN